MEAVPSIIGSATGDGSAASRRLFLAGALSIGAFGCDRRRRGDILLFGVTVTSPGDV